MTPGFVAAGRQMRLLVLAILAGLILCGCWRLPSMSVETVPDFAPSFVEIQTEASGLSVAEVGSLFSFPMKQLPLNGVAWLDDLRPGLPGFETDTSVYGLATFVDSETDEFKKSLFIGATAGVQLMAFILFDWRVVIISLLGIPLAFLAALAVLYLRGSPMSSMVFAGLVISFGAVIDGAIFDFKDFKKCVHKQREESGDVSTVVLTVTPAIGATLLARPRPVPILRSSLSVLKS